MRSFLNMLHDDDRDCWSLYAMRYRGCRRRVQGDGLATTNAGTFGREVVGKREKVSIALSRVAVRQASFRSGPSPAKRAVWLAVVGISRQFSIAPKFTTHSLIGSLIEKFLASLPWESAFFLYLLHGIHRILELRIRPNH